MSQEAANTTPKEDCIAFETISIVVPDLESLTDAEGKPKPLSSPVHKIGGLAWRMEVRKVGENESERLKLSIFCNEQVKEHLWLCKVQFTTQNEFPDAIYKQISPRTCYGFNTCDWSILPESHQYILKDELDSGHIVLKLEIRVLHVELTNLPALDTNLVVNMGEGKSETLLVSKHILAGMSTYFRNLFFEDGRDKKAQEEGNFFELDEPANFDIRAFKAMIYAAMTMGGMVHELTIPSNSLVRAIKLGVKLDMPLMVGYCEKSLMKDMKKKNCQHSKMELLELADQCNLVQLKEHCLKEMGMLDVMKDLGVYSRLSQATREQLQLRTKLADVREDKPKPDLVTRSKK